jgi:hypothetical protein
LADRPSRFPATAKAVYPSVLIGVSLFPLVSAGQSANLADRFLNLARSTGLFGPLPGTLVSAWPSNPLTQCFQTVMLENPAPPGSPKVRHERFLSGSGARGLNCPPAPVSCPPFQTQLSKPTARQRSPLARQALVLTTVPACSR